MTAGRASATHRAADIKVKDQVKFKVKVLKLKIKVANGRASATHRAADRRLDHNKASSQLERGREEVFVL